MTQRRSVSRWTTAAPARPRSTATTGGKGRAQSLRVFVLPRSALGTDRRHCQIASSRLRRPNIRPLDSTSANIGRAIESRADPTSGSVRFVAPAIIARPYLLSTYYPSTYDWPGLEGAWGMPGVDPLNRLEYLRIAPPGVARVATPGGTDDESRRRGRSGAGPGEDDPGSGAEAGWSSRSGGPVSTRPTPALRAWLGGRAPRISGYRCCPGSAARSARPAPRRAPECAPCRTTR